MLRPDKFIDEIALDKQRLMSLATECWNTYARARKYYYDMLCVEHLSNSPSHEWNKYNKTLTRSMEKQLRKSIISKFSDELSVLDFLAFKLEDHQRVLTDGIYTVDGQWINWAAEPPSKFKALYADLVFDVEIITGKSYEGGDTQIKDRISEVFANTIMKEVIIYAFRLKHYQRSESIDMINQDLNKFYDKLNLDIGSPLMECNSSKVWVTSIEGAVATEHMTYYEADENLHTLYIELEIKRPLAFTDRVFGNLLNKMMRLKNEQNKTRHGNPS